MVSFLFAGASGSGKKTAVFALGMEFYMNNDAIIYINLNKYSGLGAKNRLLRVEDGFAGSEYLGTLPSGLCEKQSCLIFFDELEKASNPILVVINTILVTGLVIDSKRNQWDVSQCIVVLISKTLTRGQMHRTILDNARLLGSEKIVKFNKNHLLNEIELLVDEVITFKSLDEHDILESIKKNLGEIIIKMELKGIYFKFTEQMTSYIYEKYKQSNRPVSIRQYIDNELIKPFDLKLLKP